MNIFDESTHEILIRFLDKKVKDAEEEISNKGTLSEEYAIPLLLKSQFNHIMHLDSELTSLRKLMDIRFEQVDKRFEQVDKRFEQVDKKFEILDRRITHLFTVTSVGFTILCFLITMFGFLK